MLRTTTRLALLLAAAIACLTQPSAAASKYQRVAAGRWELLTDANEKTAQQELRNIADIHAAISADLAPLFSAPAPPATAVRILLFRSSRDFRPFQRGETNFGLFQPGAGGDYIFSLQGGSEPQRSLAHEITHLILYRATGRLPQWLEEGLADYYATLQRAGNRVTFGAPVDSQLQPLADSLLSSPWANPDRFFAAGENLDPASAAAPLYYAQSWALVHVLMRDPAPHARIREFIRLLRDGLSQPAAFQQAFGRSPAKALEEARQAITAKAFARRAIAFEPAAVQPSPARPLSEVEWEIVRASALIDGQKTAAAEEIIKAAAKKWPTDPSVSAGLGYLALSRGDYNTARKQFETAIAAGGAAGTVAETNNAFTHFEYAMLIRDTNGPEALVIQSLRDAVQLNPAYAAAWYALGAALARAGQNTEALNCFKQSTVLVPRSAVYWEAYGRALLAAGDRPGAREAALSATASAVTPEQAQMAQSLLREADAPPLPKSASKPAVTTPSGWKPEEGDAKVAGRLVLVDCDTALLKFHIETQPGAGRTPAKKTILGTEKPNQVMLRGASAQKREFVCGPQPTRPQVEAGYIVKPIEPAPKPVPTPKKAATKKAPAPKPAALPIAGELVWLEFK